LNKTRRASKTERSAFQEKERGFDQEKAPREDVQAQVPETSEGESPQEQVRRMRMHRLRPFLDQNPGLGLLVLGRDL